MIKRLIKKLLKLLGYELNRISNIKTIHYGFNLYEYIDRDGNFDYEAYRIIQEEGNKRKLNRIWVIEDNIAYISNYIKSHIKNPRFGLCHGTRTGKEQEWFRKYIGCEVIGTEISSTAVNYPNTIQWDYHEVKPEWIDSVDFIYSNAFDHSYNPEKCLNAWMSCIKKGHICIIEHSSLHESKRSTKLDPFGAEITILPYLICLWGNGKYGLRQILDAPVKNNKVDRQCFFIIQRY